MGGSSLAPEVFQGVFGNAPGHPELIVLDTTVPAAVERAAVAGPLDSTLFLVSSKSGTTAETNALLAHFWGRLRRLRGPETGRQFVAITDPGTSLSEIAATRGFRATFHNPDDIGGRYSILSYFGLVPAALIGIDLKAFLGRAAAMAEACGAGPAPRQNPGLALGAALGELGRRGRDKIILAIDRPLEPYGLWIEQLVAESTGKDGRGLIPVVETLAIPGLDGLGGPDRVIVPIALAQGGAARDLEAMIARNPEGSPTGRRSP
jgi:glucose-6-phosphate isomerase/transaldolase/glucose-6-phosphate isomerase